MLVQLLQSPVTDWCQMQHVDHQSQGSLLQLVSVIMVVFAFVASGKTMRVAKINPLDAVTQRVVSIETTLNSAYDVLAAARVLSLEP